MVTRMIKHISEGSSAKGARSTALHSLQWGLGLILAAIPSTHFVGTPNWILTFLVVMLGILFLTYIGTFLFLLFSDRDALRSEQFTLSKMAIERGLIGDNVTGLIEANEKIEKILDAKIVNSEESTE